MVEVDFGGDFLNNETATDGDICEIKDEGYNEEREYNGKKRQVFNVGVVNVRTGKFLTYTPSQKAGLVFSKTWGKDSKAWIGKKFECKFALMIMAGQEKSILRPKPAA